MLESLFDLPLLVTGPGDHRLFVPVRGGGVVGGPPARVATAADSRWRTRNSPEQCCSPLWCSMDWPWR